MEYCNGNLWNFFKFVHQWPDMYNVMQFTGLKDKHGNDIYEGDICSTESDQYPRNKTVIWNEGLARFEFDYPLGKSLLATQYIEVIGNIHQHPQLIVNEKITPP
jgi:uncharacterized phage protein (TIGR01671 family)